MRETAIIVRQCFISCTKLGSKHDTRLDTHVPLPRATVYKRTAHVNARHGMLAWPQVHGKGARNGNGTTARRVWLRQCGCDGGGSGGGGGSGCGCCCCGGGGGGGCCVPGLLPCAAAGGYTGKRHAAARVEDERRAPPPMVAEAEASAGGRCLWSAHEREAHAWW